MFDSISLENSDSIKFYSDKLSIETVNINLNYKYKFNKKKLDKMLKINKKKYQRFSNFHLNYTTPHYPHLNQWQMIYNQIK